MSTHRGIIIKNSKSGMILDASDHIVKLREFTKVCSQFWKLEATETGKFFIVNLANGKVLDIQAASKEGANLITYAKHGGLNQQWFINSDGTIVSPLKDLAVDIRRRKYTTGTEIIAYRKHGKDNQKFTLEVPKVLERVN